MNTMHERDPVKAYQSLHAYFQREAQKYASADTPLMREAHLLQVDAILDDRNELVATVGEAALKGVIKS